MCRFLKKYFHIVHVIIGFQCSLAFQETDPDSDRPWNPSPLDPSPLGGSVAHMHNIILIDCYYIFIPSFLQRAQGGLNSLASFLSPQQTYKVGQAERQWLAQSHSMNGDWTSLDTLASKTIVAAFPKGCVTTLVWCWPRSEVAKSNPSLSRQICW